MVVPITAHSKAPLPIDEARLLAGEQRTRFAAPDAGGQVTQKCAKLGPDPSDRLLNSHTSMHVGKIGLHSPKFRGADRLVIEQPRLRKQLKFSYDIRHSNGRFLPMLK